MKSEEKDTFLVKEIGLSNIKRYKLNAEIMYGSLEINDIKILKGPDRLLRIRVIFKSLIDMERELNLFQVVVNSLLYTHHRLSTELPIKKIINVVSNFTKDNKLWGYQEGILGVEILFRKSKECEFILRHYPEELEFVRGHLKVQDYIEENQINMNEFESDYRYIDLRNGNKIPKFIQKLEYSQNDTK